MTSTNDGKDVKSNQTSGQKGKTYYIELYKSLDSRLSTDSSSEERTQAVCEAWRRVHSLCQHSVPDTHPHLLAWLQRHTSYTILQSDWPKATDTTKSIEQHTWLQEAIDAFILECKEAKAQRDGVSLAWESQLLQRAVWFRSTLPDPWSHPVLRTLLKSQENQLTDEEVLEWLKEERGVTFVTRLKQLAASRRCRELALRLASAVMERVRASLPVVCDDDQSTGIQNSSNTESPFMNTLERDAGFKEEVWNLITDIELVLLHSESQSRCIELAKQTPLHNCCSLVDRLQGRLESSPRDKKIWKNAKEVATLVAQVLVARCMVVPTCSGRASAALRHGARALVRLLCPRRLPAAAAALAAPARTAEHLHALASAVHVQCKDERKSFVCELYVRAITAGMNELERLKLKTEKESEARCTEQTLSEWFSQLGSLLSASARLSCECLLTAFSVHPSQEMYEKVRNAPKLEPLHKDTQEPNPETNSEFGSWANDSRTQTNLVKTSETLNLKSQKQANVLSTAIFAEGEALGLEADLCQDLAVLISGPRVKTLTWDMERDSLLENCRMYMERTHSGTRALTTELKYLNLDPRSFQHLPEEDDDENGAYYGIEKGYEHLVEEEEKSDDELMFEAEQTDVSHSTGGSVIDIPKRKKKSKPLLISSDEEVDPLELDDVKRSQKQERPHSKERRKEKHKLKEQFKNTDESKEHSQEKAREIRKKEKKKERKELKKKQKMLAAGLGSSATNTQGGLSRLVGMKVARQDDVINLTETADTPFINLCISDSDYDSQGKSSINSEGNDPNVLFDGLFSMDEIKSPEKRISTNVQRPTHMFGVSEANNLGLNKTHSTPNLYEAAQSQKSQVSRPNAPYQANSLVKKSIKKLLEFRRNKDLSTNPARTNIRPVTSCQNNLKPSSLISNIQRNETSDKLKLPNVPAHHQSDFVKSYSNYGNVSEYEKVIAKPVEAFSPATSYQKSNYNVSEGKKSIQYNPYPLKKVNQPTIKQSDIIQFSPRTYKPSVLNTESSSQTQYKEFLKQRSAVVIKKQPTKSCTDTLNQIQFQEFLREQSATQVNSVERLQGPARQSQTKNTQIGPRYMLPINAPSQVQQNFLRELRESANAGTTEDILQTKSQQLLNKSIPKQVKKVDNAPNTFSRRNYLHKTKQNDNKNKLNLNQTKQGLSVSMEDMHNLGVDYNKVSSLQTKGEISIARLDAKGKGCNERAKPFMNKPDHLVTSTQKPPSVLNKQHPIMSHILSNNESHGVKLPSGNDTKNTTQRQTTVSKSHLSERDQNDLLLLLRQQSKMNVRPSPKTESENSSICTNTKIITNSTHLNNSNLSIGCQNINTNLSSQHDMSNSVKPSTVIKTNEHSSVDASEPKKSRNVKGTSKNSKSPNNDSAKSDWESVMNALLAHKTPSRGPNALDVALKKDSFERRLSNESKTASSSHCSASTIKTDRSVLKHSGTKISTSNSSSLPKKQNAQDFKPRSEKNIKLTHTKESHVEIVKRSVTKAKEKHIPSVIQNGNDPFISGIPNSDFDLLGDLMDDDLRQEIGELLADDEAYGMQTVPPKIKTMASDLYLNVNKTNTTNRKPQLIIDGREIKNQRGSIITSCPSNKKGDLKLKSNNAIQNKTTCAGVSSQNSKLRIISNELVTSPMLAKNSNSKAYSNIHSDNIPRELDHNSIVMNMNNSNPVELMNKEDGVNFEIPTDVASSSENADIPKVEMANLNVFDSTQVVLTVPQTAPNVMLISNEMIYNPYTIQHTLGQNCTGYENNSYLALNQNPTNVTLFGSPTYPVIFDGAVSVPIIQSVPTNITVVPNITLNTLSAPVDTNPEEGNCVNYDNLERSTYVNNEVLDTDSMIEDQINSETSTTTSADVEENSSTDIQTNNIIEDPLEKVANENPIPFFKTSQSPQPASMNSKEPFSDTSQFSSLHCTSGRNNMLSNKIESKATSFIQESESISQNVLSNNEQPFKESIISDKDRLFLKRMQILNRKVIRPCNNNTIALTYEPIRTANLKSQNSVNCEDLNIGGKLAKAQKSDKILQMDEDELKAGGNIMPNEKSIENAIEERGNTNTIKNNINDNNSTCRRILLRSSNNLMTSPNVKSSVTDSNLKTPKPSKKLKLDKKALRKESSKSEVKKRMKIEKIKSRKLLKSPPVSKVEANADANIDNQNIPFIDIEDQIPPSVIQNSNMELIEKLLLNKTPKNPSQSDNVMQDAFPKTSIIQKNMKSQSRCEPNDNVNKFNDKNADNFIMKSNIVDNNLKSIEKPNETSTNANGSFSEIVPIPEVDKETSVKQISSTTDVAKENKYNYLKFDSKIIYDELPNYSNNPFMKCVRVKLPNGNSFKVTISGKLNVDMDEIFEEPTIKAMILKNMNSNKKCTLNVKQVKVKSQAKPSTIITHVQDVSHLRSSEKVPETIDLVSDDEENNLKIFRTEFGVYNCVCIDKNMFLKHQEKLSQKCVVKLVNCKILQKISVSNLFQDMFTTDESVLQNYNEDCKVVDDSTDVFNDIVDKNELCKDVNVNNKEDVTFIESTEVLKDAIGSDLSEKVLRDNINDYKDNHQSSVLENINQPNDKTQNITTDETPTTHQFSNKRCVLRIDRCDNLLKKLKVQKNLCFVNLVRCDSIFKNQLNVTHSNQSHVGSNDKQDTKEISLQEVSVQEASIQETSLQEESLQETLTQEAPVQAISANKISLQEISLEGTLLQELPVQETTVQETPVHETSIQVATFQETAHLQETCLEETFLQEAPMQETFIQVAPFQKTSLEEACLQETSLEETHLQEAPVREISVNETSLQNTPLQETCLEETFLREAPVHEIPGNEISLQETYLQDTSMLKKCLHKTCLEEILLQEATEQEISIKEISLQETPAQETSLHKAPLQEIPLEETLLQESPVQEISLNEISLRETSLQDTSMLKTSLHRTCLKETLLQEVSEQETLRASPVQETSLHEAPLQEIPLEEMLLQEAPVQKILLNEISLRETSLQDTSMLKTSLHRTCLKETLLQEVSEQETLRASPVQETSVHEAPLQEIPLQEAPVQEISLNEISLRDTPLQDTSMLKTSLHKICLEESLLQEMPEQEISLQESPVQETSLHEAPLQDIPLEETLLQEAPMQEILVNKKSLQETSVHETSLREASLEETPLQEAHVQETLVNEISLEEMTLQGTPLRETSSQITSLGETDLQETPEQEISIKEIPLEGTSLQEAAAQEIFLETTSLQRSESLSILNDYFTVDENTSARSSPSLIENFDILLLYTESSCNLLKQHSVPDFTCCAEWLMTKSIITDKRYVYDKPCGIIIKDLSEKSKIDDKSKDCESDIKNNISREFVQENEVQCHKVQVPSLSKIISNYFATHAEVIDKLKASKNDAKTKCNSSPLKRKIVEALDRQCCKISKVEKYPDELNTCKISQIKMNKSPSLKDVGAHIPETLSSNELHIHNNLTSADDFITEPIIENTSQFFTNLASQIVNVKQYTKIKSSDKMSVQIQDQKQEKISLDQRSQHLKSVEMHDKLCSHSVIEETSEVGYPLEDDTIKSITDNNLDNNLRDIHLSESPEQNDSHAFNILTNIPTLLGSKQNKALEIIPQVQYSCTKTDSTSILIDSIKSVSENPVLEKTTKILLPDKKKYIANASSSSNINVSVKIDVILPNEDVKNEDISMKESSSVCKSKAAISKSAIYSIYKQVTNHEKKLTDSSFVNDKKLNTMESKIVGKTQINELTKLQYANTQTSDKLSVAKPNIHIKSNTTINGAKDKLYNTENTKNIENSHNSSQFITSNKQTNVTLIYKGDSRVVLNGSIYEDPIIGTCYVFPILNKLKIKDDGNIQEEIDKIDDEEFELDGLELNVILPKHTYSKKKIDTEVTLRKRTSRTNLKRKIVDHDDKSNKKKYRKGKNIDNPKLTVCTIAETAYGKEYKNLFNYWSSIKFSFSRPFHKECIDVFDTLQCWPILKVHIEEEPINEYKNLLFIDDDGEKRKPFDPLRQTLAEEISSEYDEPQIASDQINETNFSMGFGEGSDRVIQNSEDGDKFSKFSAATLSDVKQCQPFLLSDNYDKCNESCIKHGLKIEQMEICNRFVSYVHLKDKVRSFFKKSALELRYSGILENANKKSVFDVDNNILYPYDIFSTDFIQPASCETIVNVVQVGQQLPVSAAAQNPVTCDPRVTQVTDASPQCSAENSPHEDSQSPAKTEYTELTTADISVPLPQEYGGQTELQESSKIPTHNENIPVEIEVSSEIKNNIHEQLSQTENDQNDNETDNLQVLVNKHVKNIEYSCDSNENTTSEEDQPKSEITYDNKDKDEIESNQQKQQNGTVAKTDQIAHAMSAAGITPSPEPVIDPGTQPLVDMFSSKVCQDTTSTPNNFTKTSSINAMMLQQALAQILPPPLNQTNSQEGSQMASSTTVGSQVLHIVQGKNSNGNQITVVENTQNSVISNSNTPVLHIVQNKPSNNNTSSNTNTVQHTNSYSGLSLVDTGLQQGNNQLLHIVNTGTQKGNNAGQILKRVNLLTNLANVQGTTEQKMVQFVCKSADGKSIQLNAPHQRSMVLRLQPFESPNVQSNSKTPEGQDLSPTSNNNSTTANKESHEIKSRSVYEENYAKFIQNSNSKPGSEKSTSLPKFNQAFGKQVFQDGNQKNNDINTNNSHLSSMSNDPENSDCQSNENNLNLEHIGQINSPPLLLRKSPAPSTQAQTNIVQQLKQTIAPMMHGGVIYTRQIPVNIGGGQTINLITVPSTELVDDSNQKQQGDMKFVNQNEMESPVIKIISQNQNNQNNEMASDESNNNHTNATNENTQNLPTQHQPVLTQMRIKLPMLSKAPQMVSGARVVRPSFFQIQRNVIGGANQPVYQQLVLTAAPPLGQHTIRLPQTHARQVKVASEGQSSSESQMSSSTLEQLREFDMVLEQVKERSTVQPNTNNNFCKLHTSSSDTTDSTSVTSTVTESTQQILYSIGTNQSLNVAYVNRKPTTATAYVRSPDSSNAIDSPSSSTHSQIPQTTTSESNSSEVSPQQNQPKAAKIGSKSKSRPKSSSHPPNSLKINTVPPKTSTQKPLEDEQTTQRILYILAEYKEQVENSPDKDKPAPRRRSNPPSNPSGSSKRKKSSSGSRRPGARDMSPVQGDDTCRTMGSEDSSCGTSQGDCTENCLEPNSPQDSPRKVVRKLTFENETAASPQPRQQPQRNVIVADGQTITVSRGTSGKPTTAVLMPANYILPVSMVKGGQQIAIVTNRGPKLLTVGGETGNALLLQRLIGPAGLKPVLTRPGVRHVRLPTAALHNLQAFNLTTTTTVHPPENAPSPAPAQTPPELIDSRANSSPWADREPQDVKPERASSPEGSEPWHLTADPNDYSYEETVRTENMDRTVLVVHKREGHRQHRLAHVSAAALRHKYAILEHELRLQGTGFLQKSLSEECEDLGVDSPSASELFPEAELLFSSSPAHDAQQHSHTPQPTILNQSGIPQPDIDDQIATDHLLQSDIDDQQDLGVTLGLDEGIVTVSEDGMQATIALDQEEFARSHPNTTFHSEPTEETEIQPFTITGLKGRHITSTIFHAGRAPATVLVTAPQTTVISQATQENVHHSVKYANIDHIINSSHGNLNLTKFDNILTDSRELHLSHTASAIVHSTGNATQVIRRVCYEDDRRDPRYLMDESDGLIAGDDAKMIAEDSSRDATLESMADGDEDNYSPERHAELFWESNSASERSERGRHVEYNYSSDSEKCCKSPFDETNSTDSSGVGTHMRLDSVIKEARLIERAGSGSSDDHPPLRTYPAKRMYHHTDDVERSLSGKTRAGFQEERDYRAENLEGRRRSSVRGVVKRGCHCCNGSPVPPRPKKPKKKPTIDFTN